MRKIVRLVTIISMLSILCLLASECDRFNESHLICEDEYNEFITPGPQVYTSNISVQILDKNMKSLISAY